MLLTLLQFQVVTQEEAAGEYRTLPYLVLAVVCKQQELKTCGKCFKWAHTVSNLCRGY